MEYNYIRVYYKDTRTCHGRCFSFVPSDADKRKEELLGFLLISTNDIQSLLEIQIFLSVNNVRSEYHLRNSQVKKK